MKKIILTDFFIETSTKNNLFYDYDLDSLQKYINEFFNLSCKSNETSRENYSCKLQDGYASFCKLLFIENPTKATPFYIKREPFVYPYIRTEYNARTENELPVLIEYAKIPWKLESAKYLMVILYDKKQLEKEAGHEINNNFEYGVVGIRSVNEMIEPPLPPITIMRNSLGIEHGGSGVSINKQEYLNSVKFWSENITVK
jgi:uncharacterized protein YunC (DUF1805 family)